MIETTAVTRDLARILIVDDSHMNRKKMSRAVEKLGHEAYVAEHGGRALAFLELGPFDAILLDIVMPQMDGFEFLERVRQDEELRDIPIIVVSSLEDERDSVVRAIELGAEDFLPKNFDLVLLEARLNASLMKKRFRDQEREYFGRISRLTAAASALETGRFNPQELELDELAAHDDPLGKLAKVFRGMAGEIYQRELKLRQTIDKLRSGLLVILTGVIWGVTPSLGRFAGEMGAPPLGLSLWMNALVAVILLSSALLRGRMPRLTLRDIFFFAAWALLAGIVLRTTMFVVSAHLEAAVISLVLTLQGFFIFIFAGISGREVASTRRFAGLVVGLIGVSTVMWTKLNLNDLNQNLWLALSLVVPLTLAIEAVAFAGRVPKHVDAAASVGVMSAFSCLMIAPVAYSRGELMPLLSTEPGTIHLLIVLLAGVSAASYMLAIYIIKTSGAIFYSQSAYTMTIAGVIWGMVLLDETFSVLAWIAFGVILVGMYLVEPKENEGELIIKRKFGE